MRIKTLALAVVTLAGALGTEATPLFPYLETVSVAVADQLARQPADPKSRAIMAKTLRRIDAPGKPSLAKDLKLLSVVGPALMKTSESNAFYEPLNSAVDRYLVHVMAAADLSSTKLAAAPPSPQQAAAQASLQSLNTLLAAINETSDPAQASKLLWRAATKLASTDKLIARATNPPPSTKSSTGQAGETSDSGFSWMVVSAPGASTTSTTGGLRVVVHGSDEGWSYLIRW